MLFTLRKGRGEEKWQKEQTINIYELQTVATKKDARTSSPRIRSIQDNKRSVEITITTRTNNAAEEADDKTEKYFCLFRWHAMCTQCLYVHAITDMSEHQQ